LLVRYLPYYTERERLRHKVRPGITGLAQVKGRNNLSWDDRLELDVQYVENISFKSDLNMILKTIKNVIVQKDINIIPGEKGLSLDKYREKSIKND